MNVRLHAVLIVLAVVATACGSPRTLREDSFRLGPGGGIVFHEPEAIVVALEISQTVDGARLVAHKLAARGGERLDEKTVDGDGALAFELDEGEILRVRNEGDTAVVVAWTVTRPE